MFLHADVKWVMVKRRLKMQRCPDMTQVSCTGKGLQVPDKNLESGFFNPCFRFASLSEYLIMPFYLIELIYAKSVSSICLKVQGK